jgi:hypothetical protein
VGLGVAFGLSTKGRRLTMGLEVTLSLSARWGRPTIMDFSVRIKIYLALDYFSLHL